MGDFDKEANMLGSLAVIRESFLQRTRGELPVLLELLERIQGGDSTGLEQLQNYAHRIHGSGAMFDFAAISESAGQMENLLEVLTGSPTASAVEPHYLRCVVESGRRLAVEIGAATTQGSAADH
jgi:HPt (histidine-containing phosphotransfer) domain-containing protein